MLTLAPGVTLWDSGEFLAAIHSLGIPHPPGTPLYVLIGKVWSLAFASLFGFARSINLLSAVCVAFGCGILTNLFTKWTQDSFAATAAGLDGLKGHRSVGGMRASIYNAFPEDGVDALVAFMREFERKQG